MKTVLITGVNGFIGTYAARHFADRGWSVVGVDGNSPHATVLGLLRRFVCWNLPDSRLGKLLQEEVPELCVHCAGRASVPGSFADPDADFFSGPPLVFDLLTQVRHHSPRTKFLFLSSAAVYGNPAKLPVSEEALPAPASPYGYHKLLCEKLCEEFARLFGLATASLRIFSAYGPGLRRQVIWDILQKTTLQSEVVLQGTGAESRDFIHAVDIARTMAHLAQTASFTGEVYNLGSGRETTIRELAQHILQIQKVQRPVRFDGLVPPGVPRQWRADIGKLTALGFTPSISLRQGLADVSQWFRQEVLCSRQNSASA